METIKKVNRTPRTAAEPHPPVDSPQDKTLKQQFVAAAFSMSWQLAIVVLVPVVGGFKLDQRLKSAPLWTIVGFIVAITGMVLVLRRTLKAVAVVPKAEKKDL